MAGFITDTDLNAANRVYPGIKSFYQGLQRKPGTFLELQWLFLKQKENLSDCIGCAMQSEELQNGFCLPCQVAMADCYNRSIA